MGVVCGGCGASNRDGARFCSECGAELNLRCPACDAGLRPIARFCDSCGAPVAAPTTELARKTVTVVFADLAGSTSMQERMDPESVRAFNARCYSAMRNAVERHAGRVVKFVGDGMMAVFGVPEVREDDAVRALAAAVDLREALHDVAVRIGVNSGEVVVDDSDDDVVGDTVNVAARLEGAAPLGQVLVGEETYRLARDHAAFAEPHELQVKGRSEPVVARLLVAVGSTADDAGAGFVGREAELARLVGAIGTVEATRHAHLVTVIGFPGVGKSRLLAELDAAVRDVAAVLVGRCDAAGGPTFAPVVDIVAGAIDLAGDVDGDVAAAVAPLLGEGDPATPERTFWGVRRVIEAAARVRPLLVVLDDAHWAEPMLLDLVEHLAEWLRDSPVLLVVAARPELRELRPALVDVGARPSAVVSLEGLDADATRLLAAELLGAVELPAAIAGRVVEATEGNPLFVRELVRMLVDDGVLRAEGDAWVLAVDAEAIDVPPTISSLLAARVERLRADERMVLERAAVVGSDVFRGALLHLLPPTNRASLDVVLESLRRKELLEPAGTYWIDEPVLRFHHALIRDAAYRRVLREARADLHERTATWLVDKTGGGAELDELIGFHLEQAQTNLRQLGELDERGRTVAAEAASRLAAAAERSLHRNDLTAAAALAGRALACLDPDDPRRAELLLVRCESLLGTGAVADARPAVDELAATAGGDERLAAWSTAFAVQLSTLSGAADLDAAGRAAPEAAGRLSALGDPTGAAKAHRVHASVLARLGRVAATEAALDRALTAAREAGDQRQISGVLAAAPLAALWGPSPVPRAGGRCLDIVRLLRITTGAREVEAVSTRCQAVLEAFRGRHDAARRMLDSARAILEDLGLRHGLLELDLFAGIVELAAGEPAAAAEHLTAAHQGFAALGADVDAAQAAALRGRAALLLGDTDAALELAATAERLGGRDLKTAIAWRTVTAEVLAARGDHDRAVRLAQEAVALADPTDALVDRADAHAALAAVLSLAGDAAGAAEAEERARSLYSEKGATALAERLGESAVEEPTETAVPDRSAAPANRAVRLQAVNIAHMNAGRWEDYRDGLHPDFVFEDRTHEFSWGGMAREDVETLAEATVDVGGGSVEARVVAVRGDDLVLARLHIASGDNATESLVITRFGADDRIVHVVQFDPDDLDTAMAELDRLAAEVPLENRAVRVARANARRTEERRWEDYRAHLHPDIEVRNGMPITVGTMDRDQVVELTRSTMDVGAPRLRHKVVEIRGEDLALVEALVADDDATAWTSLMLVVIGSDEQERQTHAVIFEPEDREAAVAELDRLHRKASLGNRAYRVTQRNTESLRDAARAELDRLAAAPADNAAVWACRQANRWMVASDWQAYGAAMHPDVVYEDRRPGLATRIVGREACVANARTGAATGITHIDAEAVATAGDHAALVRLHVVAAGFDVESLQMITLHPSGLVERSIGYDPSQLDDALAELRRHVPVADAPVTSDEPASEELTGSRRRFAELSRTADDTVLGLGLALVDADPYQRFVDALNAGDLDALDRVLSPRFRLLRHAALSYGALDRDAAIATLRASFAPRDGHQLEIEAVLRDDPGGRLVRTREVDGSGGGVVELRHLGAATWTAGQLDRLEYWDADDIAAAEARFEELVSVQLRTVQLGDDLDASRTELDRLPSRYGDRAGGGDLRNRATAAFFAGADRQSRGRPDELRVAEGFTFDERRSLIGGSSQTGAARTAPMVSGEFAVRLHDLQVIAIRGDRLALVRNRYTYGEDDGDGVFESSGLCVLGVDETGVADLAVTFDDDRLADALLELDLRYGSAVAVASARLAHAVNAGDTTAMLAALAPDAEAVDHTPAGFGYARGAAAVTEVLQTIAGVGDGHVALARRHLAETEHVALCELRHGVIGETVRSDVLGVLVAAGGRITRYETFAVDDLDAARRRFEELAAPPLDGTDLRNRATAAYFAHLRLSAEGDLDALRVADGFRFLDRRPGLGADVSGDATEELVRGRFRTRRSGGRVLAVRGDRLALLGSPYRYPDSDFESESYSVLGVDENGEADLSVVFGPDQLDVAVLELDAQGASPAVAAFDRSAHVLVGAEPGELAYARQVLDERDGVALVQFRVDTRDGTTRHGLCVVSVDGEAVVDHEVFAVGHEAAARRRFAGDERLEPRRYDELTASPTLDRGDRETGGGVVAPGTSGLGHRPIVASRGERLVLLGGDDLVVAELDDDDMPVPLATYGRDDLGRALDDLADRFQATLPDDVLAAILIARAVSTAFSEGDADAFQRLLAPDFRFVDHFLVGMGEITKAEMVQDVAPFLGRDTGYALFTSEVLAVNGRGGVFRMQEYDHNATGGDTQQEQVTVTIVRDGLVQRIENFPADAADRAVALFSALTTPPAPTLTNRAAAALQAFNRAFARRDWTAIEPMFDARHELVDRRSRAGGTRLDRVGALGSARSITSLRFTEIHSEVLAVRDEHLVLARQAYVGAGNEVVVLELTEVDQHGRFVFGAVFEPGDLAAAVDELDHRFEATLPPAERAVVVLQRQGVAAFAVGDTATAESLLSPAFVLVDHRAVGLGTVDRESAVAVFDAVTDRGVGYVRYAPEIVRLSGWGSVVRNREVETAPDGGTIETETVNLTIVADGAFERLEIFPADGADAALARFDELTGGDGPDAPGFGRRGRARS